VAAALNVVVPSPEPGTVRWRLLSAVAAGLAAGVAPNPSVGLGLGLIVGLGVETVGSGFFVGIGGADVLPTFVMCLILLIVPRATFSRFLFFATRSCEPDHTPESLDCRFVLRKCFLFSRFFGICAFISLLDSGFVQIRLFCDLCTVVG
jgi:hypothetical protein